MDGGESSEATARRGIDDNAVVTDDTVATGDGAPSGGDGRTGPAADPLPRCPVVVVGLMGSGKTTVASRLAGRWGRPFRDSDADLLAETGSTAAELARREGADRLHALEADHLLRALDEDRDEEGHADEGHGGDDRGDLVPRPVVAAAASVVEDERCRAALGPAAVVWLDADPAELARRQADGGHRPAYDEDLGRMLRDMDARRRPLFTAVADLVVLSRAAAPGEDPGRWIEALVDEAAAGLAGLARPGGTGPDVKRGST